MTNQRILSHFHESAELKIQSATVLAPHIAQAIEMMFSALSNGNKILCAAMAVRPPMPSTLRLSWWAASSVSASRCRPWR
jgi:hypothetical protein